MITLQQFQDILGDSFFSGDIAIAGIVIFVAIMAVVFVVLQKNTFAALVISIPLALLFLMMGILTSDLAMILIVVSVLGLATVAKKTLGE